MTIFYPQSREAVRHAATILKQMHRLTVPGNPLVAELPEGHPVMQAAIGVDDALRELVEALEAWETEP